jgi:hypothetical protein
MMKIIIKHDENEKKKKKRVGRNRVKRSPTLLTVPLAWHRMVLGSIAQRTLGRRLTVAITV